MAVAKKKKPVEKKFEFGFTQYMAILQKLDNIHMGLATALGAASANAIDQDRLVKILLARCDAQDKAIGNLELKSTKQYQQMERMVTLMGLMFRAQQRFYKESLEPQLVESISNELKAPLVQHGA